MRREKPTNQNTGRTEQRHDMFNEKWPISDFQHVAMLDTVSILVVFRLPSCQFEVICLPIPFVVYYPGRNV